MCDWLRWHGPSHPTPHTPSLSYPPSPRIGNPSPNWQTLSGKLMLAVVLPIGKLSLPHFAAPHSVYPCIRIWNHICIIFTYLIHFLALTKYI
ncbi:hypothetical protein Hanom_Chr10g00929811 [Helianthus anomalus]